MRTPTRVDTKPKEQRTGIPLLDDWDTFWLVLDHPGLPLTNNAEQRAQRYRVIAQRIS